MSNTVWINLEGEMVSKCSIKMEERIEKFLEVNEGSRIVYQLNDKVENECFLKI